MLSQDMKIRGEQIERELEIRRIYDRRINALQHLACKCPLDQLGCIRKLINRIDKKKCRFCTGPMN